MSDNSARFYQGILKKSALAASAIILSQFAFANDINTRIKHKLNDTEALQDGKQSFQQACVSCHAKDLSGASGFNLKDGEWIHGSSPSDIFNNIKRGFVDAGMPEFGSVYPADKIENIVAYILTKREGFSSLEYKIFLFEEDAPVSFDFLQTSKAALTGKLHDGLADFDLPEAQYYGLEFNGTFYAPGDKTTMLLLEAPKELQLEVIINGEKIAKQKGEGSIMAWPLVRGEQQLTLRYITTGTPEWFKKNLQIYVANEDLDIKLYPVSSAAKATFKKSSYTLTVDSEAQVQRKKIVKLPPFSVSVGLPEKLNYAFNTLNCSIVGLWRGEFLDVGPNIEGRGKFGSLPLGKWVFHYPQHLGPHNESHIGPMDKSEKTPVCKFEKYTRQGNPRFYFTYDGIAYSMEAVAHDDHSLLLKYTVLSKIKPSNFLSRLFGDKNRNKGKRTLEIMLPNEPSLSFSVEGAELINKKHLLVDVEKVREFSVNLIFKEQE